MKVKHILQSLFVLVLGMLFADTMMGIIQKREWKAPIPSAQDAGNLFGNIKQFGNAPQDLPKMEFRSINGEVISPENFRGRYVLLNAWATWCAPCVKELPALQNLKQALAGSNWEVMAVSIDFDTNIQNISSFVQNNKTANVAGYYDVSGKLQDLVMEVGGVPVTYLLSPEGKIIARINGSAAWDSPPIIGFLENLSKPAP